MMEKESAIGEDGYRKYLNALLDGDKGRCTVMVQEYLGGDIEIYDLYINLLQRSMYEVGALWESNRISVAKEHLASSITESLLSLVYPRIFAADHLGKKAIVACVANEYHQLGGKMVADILELHGWDGYFLGANTPPEELLKLIDEKKPDLIGLSLAIYSNLDNLLRVVEMVQTNSRGLPIIVGGQAFRWGGAEAISKYPAVQYVSSLSDLEKISQ
jgi:MerR family transcriptional regulator, light-induced transcriptional regulator